MNYTETLNLKTLNSELTRVAISILAGGIAKIDYRDENGLKASTNATSFIYFSDNDNSYLQLVLENQKEFKPILIKEEEDNLFMAITEKDLRLTALFKALVRVFGGTYKDTELKVEENVEKLQGVHVYGKNTIEDSIEETIYELRRSPAYLYAGKEKDQFITVGSLVSTTLKHYAKSAGIIYSLAGNITRVGYPDGGTDTIELEFIQIINKNLN